MERGRLKGKKGVTVRGREERKGKWEKVGRIGERGRERGDGRGGGRKAE